ncbi:MauE/DoxX family redox-associated membrane protein [Actinomadura sp. KC345]|uniref:MauE/DoxX family redox-associated membrane protein n=1 Tax=Actinomadura sp. KC345 TaxID=2530371 RepID=UPI00140546EA
MAHYLLFCRVVLAGIFVVSLISKTRGRNAYREFVDATRALLEVPSRRARPLAGAAVAAEAGTVVLLTVPGMSPTGFAVAAGLLSCFTVALVRAVRRGTGASCGCFGATAAPAAPRHVIRNLLLIALACGALATLLLETRPAPGMAGGALTALVAVTLTALILRLDDLVDLFRKPPVLEAAAGQRRAGGGKHQA